MNPKVDWLRERLGVRADTRIRVRAQNMSKKSSRVTRFLLEHDLEAETVLWAWRANGYRPVYLGAFIRCAELDSREITPGDVFYGGYREVARGSEYVYYTIRSR